MHTQQDNKPVYIILGATGGIGAELSRILARQGAHLVLAARHEDRLHSLAYELNADYRAVDATSIDEVDTCVKEAMDKYGTVSGIANCVGSILLKPAHLTSEQEWLDTITLNLNTAFAAVRAAGKHMRRSGGSVVLIASAAAQVGLANHEAIAAAKGGVIGLTRSAAATYAPKIRVNCVAPGLVDTPLAGRITSNESALKSSQSMHPMQRIGTPNDIAAPMAWLLDPNTSWVTGQAINIDGGLSTVRV
ncbi:SDR family oxidoreductase [bacterium]|nr:SDR family oxidoreductase [bacterium]